jgi:hypothetical protein
MWTGGGGVEGLRAVLSCELVVVVVGSVC